MSSMRSSAAGLCARRRRRPPGGRAAVCPAAVFSRAIVTRAGFFRWRSAIDRIRAGMVAENSAVWRVSGVALRIASRSSAKPMSSISSASSSTSTLTRVELQRLAADVIERAARRGDDNVSAALERAHLLVHRRAAVQRQDRQAHALGVLVDRFGDLHGQFARRARAPGRRSAADQDAPGQSAAASAARTPRSCRSPFRPGRASRAHRAAAGWSRAGRAWAPHSPGRTRRRQARAAIRGWRS